MDSSFSSLSSGQRVIVSSFFERQFTLNQSGAPKIDKVEVLKWYPFSEEKEQDLLAAEIPFKVVTIS